ncbi:hypothetical protein [Pararhizobium sp.]|uniref:hypothetical protein n=1 Tax=Pararhizobium sp. TaxID=1977563 RepID=UPI003D123260
MKKSPKFSLEFSLPLCSVLGFLFLPCNSASAGWYQVKNYEGTVGRAPVHLSLQTFDKLNGETDTRIVGSYYYDSRRVPLKLAGNRISNGDITLCESDLGLENPQPAAEPRCTFTLGVSSKGLTGTWKSGTTSFDVQLHEVGELDNNGEERNEGTVEIPMWYVTRKVMFLGVYKKVDACEKIVMSHLKTVSIVDGQILDNTLLDQAEKDAGDDSLACEAGLLMTEIYSNLEPGDGLNSVTIHYGGGKMGYDAIARLERNAY